MGFPCLDGSFGGAAAVAVGRYKLELDVVFFECFLELVGALVVKDAEGGVGSVCAEFGMKGCPGVRDLFGLSSGERMG